MFNKYAYKFNKPYLFFNQFYMKKCELGLNRHHREYHSFWVNQICSDSETSARVILTQGFSSFRFFFPDYLVKLTSSEKFATSCSVSLQPWTRTCTCLCVCACVCHMYACASMYAHFSE